MRSNRSTAPGASRDVRSARRSTGETATSAGPSARLPRETARPLHRPSVPTRAIAPTPQNAPRAPHQAVPRATCLHAATCPSVAAPAGYPDPPAVNPAHRSARPLPARSPHGPDAGTTDPTRPSATPVALLPTRPLIARSPHGGAPTAGPRFAPPTDNQIESAHARARPASRSRMDKFDTPAAWRRPHARRGCGTARHVEEKHTRRQDDGSTLARRAG